MSNNGPCINCGEPTENTEHVCTDCTAGARLRLHLKGLSDDELMEKPVGGRPSQTAAPAAVSNRALAEEFDVNERTVRRYKLTELADRGLITLDEIPEAKPHLAQARGQEEWNTPDALLLVAREAMDGIDLDPASNSIAQSRVRAREFYTKEEDGLTQPWRGRIYLNPPYTSGLVGKFADKLIAEYVAGNVTEAVWLTNNSTDTGWFHRLAEQAAVMVFLRGRVKFWKVGEDGEELQGSPLQGQVLMYLGPNARRFVTACAGQEETNGYASTHWSG